MKHSRFKYFSKLEHAELFLDGKVRCRTAAYFRDYEDAQAKQIVGDEYEGTRLFRPQSGLEVNHERRKETFLLDMGLECHTRAHEIYILCLTNSFNDVLRHEFQAEACVQVIDPKAFIHRWLKAIPEEARKDGKNVTCRVRYYQPGDVPGIVWAFPRLITTAKLKRFEYQNEYRLAYTTTDAFAFENCTYQLVDRKVRPAPRPEEHFYQDLELGNLHDLCRLHVF